MRPSRRTLLLGAGASTVLVVAGATALVLQPTLLRTPRTALRVLDQRLFSVLAAVGDRVCPAVSGLPSAWDLQVPERADAVLDTLHEASTAEVLLALRLLESGLFGLLDGRATAFTRASPETQDRALLAWRDSTIPERKAGYKALVSLVSSLYWSSEETWPHLGYDGPPRFPSEALP